MSGLEGCASLRPPPALPTEYPTPPISIVLHGVVVFPGCTHFIVGRDMAGSKSSITGDDFYGMYDAQVNTWERGIEWEAGVRDSNQSHCSSFDY
jgi:ATP sulfurylase